MFKFLKNEKERNKKTDEKCFSILHLLGWAYETFMC